MQGIDDSILDAVASGWPSVRGHCEYDTEVLQPIPYIVVFGPNRTVFRYLRSTDRKQYGDNRLGGKWSLGVGGHIRPEDGPDFIRNCIVRELEEEIELGTTVKGPTFAGTLYCEDRPIDKVHFGLVHVIRARPPILHRPGAQVSSELIPISEAQKVPGEYESWSKLLLPHLGRLYRI